MNSQYSNKLALFGMAAALSGLYENPRNTVHRIESEPVEVTAEEVERVKKEVREKRASKRKKRGKK